MGGFYFLYGWGGGLGSIRCVRGDDKVDGRG